MSVFVSSAVTGKRVAPKTAGRRRAAPPAAKPSEPGAESVEPVSDVNVLPSPASTEAHNQSSQYEQHASLESGPEPGQPVDNTNVSGGASEYLATPQSSAVPLSRSARSLGKRPLAAESTREETRASKRGRLSPPRERHDEAGTDTLGSSAESYDVQPAIDHANIREDTSRRGQDRPPLAYQQQQLDSGQTGHLATSTSSVTDEGQSNNDSLQPSVSTQTSGTSRRARRPAPQRSLRSRVPPESDSPTDGIDQHAATETREGEESTVHTPASGRDDPTPAPRRRGRKKAIASPADVETLQPGIDPEDVKINASEMSMFELSHEDRFGAVSEREKKMASIDWDEVHRKRKEAIAKLVAGFQPAESKTDESTETTGKPGSHEPGASQDAVEPEAEAQVDQSANQPVVAPSGGLRFRMVDGQIVEDEDTLAIDRQAVAEANALNDEPVEEENDLTVRVNRSTWTNNRRRDVADRVPVWKSKSDPWTDEETDRFYDALRMFGTDFFIISKMFPPKTRRQIKTKFTREEKIDPVRINNALMGKETKKMDIEHYAQQSGHDVSVYTKYDSYEHANEVIRESLKEKEQMYEQAMREEAENARQETIQREQRKAAAENRKATRRGRKGPMGMGTLGGGQEDG